MAGEAVTYSPVDVSVPGLSGTFPSKSIFGWIVIHQRIDNIFDWHLGWGPYRDGFGDIDSNFWFGLDKVHRLTDAQSYRLRVEMRDIATGDWYSVEYSYFHVGPASDYFRLNVDGYNGDAYNSLQYAGGWVGGDEGTLLHDGMKFSTRDQDNDLSSDGQCAWDTTGGWWYNNCYMTCLCCNGGYHTWYYPPETAMALSLDFSRMMIKPQS